MDAMVPLGVDAEDAVGPEDPEQKRRRDDEDTEREPDPADRPEDVSAIREQLGAEHRERHDDVLHAGEDGERAEAGERKLCAPSRLRDHADA